MAMMRRVPKGGTTRPTHARPGNGYGRAVKPRPAPEWRLPDEHRTDWFDLLLVVATNDSERATA